MNCFIELLACDMNKELMQGLATVGFWCLVFDLNLNDVRAAHA